MPTRPTGKTRFAKRLIRLGWTLDRAAAWTRTPARTLERYSSGHRGQDAPRAVMRLLAAWRLLNWRKPTAQTPVDPTDR